MVAAVEAPDLLREGAPGSLLAELATQRVPMKRAVRPPNRVRIVGNGADGVRPRLPRRWSLCGRTGARASASLLASDSLLVT